MFILVKDKSKIISFVLDKDINYKGICICKHGDNYYIELKKGYYFLNDEKIKKLNIGKYEIKQDNAYYVIEIYIYANSKGYSEFKLYKNKAFIIANNPKASIISKDPYLKDCYLVYRNDELQSNVEIIVNHYKYNGDKLKQGDVIEFLGIKVIYFDEFLYINSFNNINRLEEYSNTGCQTKYKSVVPKDNYYIPEDLFDLQIEELKEYTQPKKPNNFDFIKSIIPNFIMSITMCFMAYSNYVNNAKNGESNILSFIIMPLSMLITSVLIPILFTIISNNQYKKECEKIKNEYITYLIEYKNNLLINIDKYIASLNSRFFDILNNKKMMFYANANSDEFMKLSIGHITISKNIDINKTNDVQIDDYLKQIEKAVQNIENYPLYLDISKNKRITIISKPIDKKHYFETFLLELAYKHHYDDINIGVYSKDSNIFNDIFNLPHLFIANRRLTLNSEEQLQELNQLKLEKPLVLLLYEKCNCIFTNENIYVIYFSTEQDDIYKEYDAIIDYTNTRGLLYCGKRQIFNYNYLDIDFISYFSIFGRLRSIYSKNKDYTFKNVFNKRIGDYYSNNDRSLKATFAYNNNELISLDLHETKQGPHGLIGGSTGSGKSELIVSLLLSLCIRYSPEYLNIVLIDYKGGGLKESLSFNGVSIPHIVASLSNLENHTLERLIIALQNECKKRQMLFKRLSSNLNVSIMNLDDYLDNNINKYENISHLLIVVDEFAELKKENPEQIKELISISRIGRSLGIHLILATQKPAGVIDDEIWSNSRFKIALKVFDERDSLDIIKCKDAAYLNNPGSFIMRVDAGLTFGQSIYAKNDINGNDLYKVSTLNSELVIEKTHKISNIKTYSSSAYFSKTIIDMTKDYKIKPIDYLPPVPKNRENININNNFVFGEIDDYINSKKGTLFYSIEDSILIYSTRKNEINSILNMLSENNKHTIVIGKQIYEGRYISDSILYDSSEDIEYLFKLLNNNSKKITLVIEDVSCLLSYNELYCDVLYKLIKKKDSLNINMIFLTSSSQLSFKIINSFKNKLLINISEQSDVSAFFNMRTPYKAKSYFYDDKPIGFVPINIEEYRPSKNELNSIVKKIPEIIMAYNNNGEILIGYDEETKEMVFSNTEIVVVSFDKDILEIYAKAYAGIKTSIYSYKTVYDNNDVILWLGPGIFNQRLFISGLKDDIQRNQGILFNGSKTILIRSINNV